MKFGKFDDINKEYVINTPRTPYPWINYLGNKDFFSLISNTSGGYSFYKDARLRRITRYRYNNVPIDMGGRYFYINDNGTVWNPGWSPVKTELDFYECRHGMGYTIVTGKKDGLKAEVTFFVPNDFNGEVQQVVLTNESDKNKEFNLYSFQEWCLWDAQDDCTNFQRNFSTGTVEVDGSFIYHLTEYKDRRNHYAFYYMNDKVDGFDTDRDSFIGLYNGFNNPQVVIENKSRNSVADGWSPIASHNKKIKLKKGESKTLIFILGYVENEVDKKFNGDGSLNKEKALSMVKEYNIPSKVNKGLNNLRKSWDKLLRIINVKTPDEKVDRMVNIWNQYQCMVTFNLSRSASYFESGIGRGMGFRDSNQDILGFVHQIPERARERILDLARTQLSDGGCFHQYQPLTKKGNSDIGGDFSDDPLWMILSVSSYIKETGDFDILNEKVSFDDKDDSNVTLLDHLDVSFYHIVNNLGPHGLPLAMRADWNDCMNLSCYSDTPGESFQTYTNKMFESEGGYSKVAESLMVATLFTYVGPNYAEILKHLGKDDEAKAVQIEIDKMKDNVIKYGFDGEWFLRAYDAKGNKVGSKECEEGKIFIEPQGFAVMSEIGKDLGYDIKTLNSIDKYLNTKHGLVLNNPAFTKYYIEYGEISTYPKGYKENAGIFTHNNAWIICAEAYAGRGEKAFEYYSKIAPAFNEEISDLHKTEPYVYGQMVAGIDASRFGEGKNSWLTGTAAWNMVAISQYILGIKPEFDGLRVDPSIPADWKEFKVKRTFRNTKFDITIKNPNGVNKGIKKVLVDKVEIDGNILKSFNDNKTHKVEVIMG